jgi:hypothetical protein
MTGVVVFIPAGRGEPGPYRVDARSRLCTAIERYRARIQTTPEEAFPGQASWFEPKARNIAP